ncbi:MAG: TRAP transporter small permease subunit [Spirochaetia bacterium]|nr:TRAP transporter small permease subunit [Spirochaetia bacterium]
MTYKMIARNFLSSENAIYFSDKISTLIPHFVLLLGFLGASIGISRNEVISIDLFTRSINEQKRKIITVIVYVFTGILIFLFLFFALQSVEFGDKYWIWLGYIPALLLIFIKSFIKVFS